MTPREEGGYVTFVLCVISNLRAAAAAGHDDDDDDDDDHSDIVQGCK